MSSQRHSCERCRQQKVRCDKSSDSQSGVASCERCLKANMTCVYSLKPRPQRPSNQSTAVTTPLRTEQSRQDLDGVASGSDMSGPFVGDPTFLPLDLGDNDLTHLEDTGLSRYMWTNTHTFNPALTPALSVSNAVPSTQVRENPGNGLVHDFEHQQDEEQSIVDSLVGQLVNLSNQVTRSTSQLKTSVPNSSLTVDSLAVNEAFEAANTLVRILNNIPLANHTPSFSGTFRQHDDDEPRSITHYSLVFTALASHQHVLTLFETICHSVQQSLEALIQQQQPLHSPGPSRAQLAMVLQLLMHLTNRIAQSFRPGRRDSANQVHEVGLLHTHTFTNGLGGTRSGTDFSSVVDFAQDILRRLPDEHVMLAQNIRSLQTRIDDVQY
ncbi:hypothetical protein KCU78_g730, partial [Aureobasidium melanogenum]